MKTSHALLAALSLSVGPTGCVATIHPGEAGIWYRPYAKHPIKDTLAEGKYHKAPWNHVVVYEVREQHAREDVQIQTSDQLQMGVTTSISFRLRPEKLYDIHETLGEDYYRTAIKPLLITAIRTEFAKYTHDVVVPESAQLQHDIRVALQSGLDKYGIDVSHVVFDKIDYPQQITSEVIRQMTTVEEIKNREFDLSLARKSAEVDAAKAKGEAEAKLAAKEADRTIAQKDAEIAQIHAKAEADADKLLSEGVTPLYLKLRTLQAMEKLADSPNTKVYLMPESKGLPMLLEEPASGAH